MFIMALGVGGDVDCGDRAEKVESEVLLAIKDKPFQRNNNSYETGMNLPVM